jgi:hypothetical protein
VTSLSSHRDTPSIEQAPVLLLLVRARAERPSTVPAQRAVAVLAGPETNMASKNSASGGADWERRVSLNGAEPHSTALSCSKQSGLTCGPLYSCWPAACRHFVDTEALNGAELR